MELDELLEKGIELGEDWLRISEEDKEKLIMLGFAAVHVFSELEKRFTKKEMNDIFNPKKGFNGIWN